MLKAKVNDRYEFEIDIQDGQLKVDDQNFPVDIAKTSQSGFHLLKGKKSFNVEIIDVDRQEKTMVLLVNGREYQINIKDRYDLLLKKLGMSKMAAVKINQIEAPMPGKVLDIFVKEGKTVNKGDKLLVLEAMKMENVIKAPGDGKVKKIHVDSGDAVEKKELLVELE